MGEHHHGLALLCLFAAATGCTITLTPCLGGQLRAVLDPGGLDATWTGPAKGALKCTLPLRHTHTYRRSDDADQTTTFTAHDADGFVLARAKALATLLQVAAAGSAWHAMAVIATPAEGGSLLFVAGENECPALHLAGQRIRELGGEVHLGGGRVVADA